MVNFAFGDGSALRIAGRTRQVDGYVKDAAGGDGYNSTDTNAVRVAYHLEPGNLKLDLIGNYQVDDTTGTSFKSHTFNPTNPITGAVLGNTGVSSGATLSPGAGFEGGKPLGLDRKVYGLTALAEFKINDSLSLSSITATRAFHSNEVFDPDGTSLPILTFAEDAQGRQQSQELRLRYDNGGRFSGFVGANYFHETGSWRIPGQFDERLVLALLAGNTPLGISRPNPQPLAVLTNPAYLSQVLQLGFGIPAALAPGLVANLKPVHREEFANYGENTAYDVYADGTFKLTDKFEITAGLRYTSENREAAYRSTVQNGRSILGILLAAPTPTNLFLAAQPNAVNNPLLPIVGLIAQPTTNNGDTFSKKIDDSGLTYRLVGRYAASDDLSLYASFARGRRPDVISASAPAAALGAGALQRGRLRDGQLLRGRRQGPPAGRPPVPVGLGVPLRLRQLRHQLPPGRAGRDPERRQGQGLRLRGRGPRPGRRLLDPVRHLRLQPRPPGKRPARGQPLPPVAGPDLLGRRRVQPRGPGRQGHVHPDLHLALEDVLRRRQRPLGPAVGGPVPRHRGRRVPERLRPVQRPRGLRRRGRPLEDRGLRREPRRRALPEGRRQHRRQLRHPDLHRRQAPLHGRRGDVPALGSTPTVIPRTRAG
jgi:hypothetical protein